MELYTQMYIIIDKLSLLLLEFLSGDLYILFLLFIYLLVVIYVLKNRE